MRKLKLADFLNVLANPDFISNRLKKFVIDLGLECNMEKLGLNTISSREEIAKKVNLERLKNNPVVLTKENISQIFNI